MTSATQKSTKRIACVGEDDEAFVAALLCELEQLGLNARHMSAFSLRLAPRPPDLTVLLGDATENGGGEIADQLGTARGPIAVVMPPGALAARLEARQRGFFVVPRSEEPAKLARALVALLDSDEEKAATLEDAPPSPPPSDEATDTVFEAVTVRPEPSRPKPPPIPKPRAIPRKTLLGIAASPPIPAPAKLQAADPHQAITHPQAAAPEQLEHETKELRIPEARDGSAPIGTRKNAFTAQERMDTTGGEPPKRVDPDVTAPQAPLFEEMGELASPEAALVDAGETPTATAAPLSKTAHRAETTHEPSLAATPSMPAPAAPVEPSTTVQPIARTMVLDPDSLPIRAAPTPAADARPPSLPSASPDALLHAPSAGPQAPAPKRGRLILTLAVGGLVGGLAFGGGAAAVLYLRSSSGSPAIAESTASTPIASPPSAPAEPSEDPSPAQTLRAEATQAGAFTESAAAEERAAPEERAPEAHEPSEGEEGIVAAAAVAAASPTAETKATSLPHEELTPEQARAESDVFVREGREHERAGRLEEAIAAFTRAAEIHAHNPHAHAGLARTALAAGRPQEAIRHAERAVRLRRRRAEYHLLVGDARRAAGDAEGARRAYEEALERDPENRDARSRLGR